MTPLESHLRSLRDAGNKGVIPYVTAGDPDVETTGEILVALAEAGAAAIEVGIPFSDPIADGPTIQAASQRALDAGASLDAILSVIETRRAQITCPLVIFSYLNPLAQMGYEAFAKRAKALDISAVLVTDAVPGVEPALEGALSAEGLDRIVLVAPTTPDARIPHLASHAGGFVYVIARRGVTGKGAEQEEAPSRVAQLREHTNVPIYVGFGVRTRADVERISAYADGVIVGSALVDLLHNTERAERPKVAGEFLRGLLGE